MDEQVLQAEILLLEQKFNTSEEEVHRLKNKIRKLQGKMITKLKETLNFESELIDKRLKLIDIKVTRNEKEFRHRIKELEDECKAID